MMADRRSRLRAPRRFPLIWALGCVAFAMTATTAHGQTLFARSDTTPNYPAYRSIEECLMVGYRVTDAQLKRGKTVWRDTLLLGELKQLDKTAGIDADENVMTAGRPDSAIQATKACLSRFNADTATVTSWKAAVNIVEALLMARRDDDAGRFAHRFFDALRPRSPTDYKDGLQALLALYVRSRPLRLGEVKQLHAQLLTAVKGDSLYRSIDADRSMARVARAIHDTVLLNEVAWRAIRNNDATSVDERNRSRDSYRRLNELKTFVVTVTQDAGLDSLAISTAAYNLYVTNTVKRRVYGGNGGKPFTAADSAAKPYKMPDLLGPYSYTPTGPRLIPSNQGPASYIKQGAVAPGALPVRNRLNYIITCPSTAYAESETRIIMGGNESKGYCAYTELRQLRERYPEFEIIVLSDTYGHVGKVALAPEQEADTLAKLILGHHRVPAHLLVENRPFFRVESPDLRRVDLPTPTEELPIRRMYKMPWTTDKEGYVVEMMDSPGTAWFTRAYEILKNRPSQ